MVCTPHKWAVCLQVLGLAVLTIYLDLAGPSFVSSELVIPRP